MIVAKPGELLLVCTIQIDTVLQQPQGSTTVVTEPTSMKIINAKLDRIISLLEKLTKAEE